MSICDDVEKGNLDKVKLYVENGGDVNKKSEAYNTTLIYYACWYGHLDIVSYLIEVGADTEDIHYDGCNLLHVSSYRGHTHITEYLLKNECCDIEKCDIYGVIPLREAIRINNLDCVKLLLGYNPSTYYCVNNRDKTALDLAYDSGHQEVINYLKNWSPTTKGQTIKAAR